MAGRACGVTLMAMAGEGVGMAAEANASRPTDEMVDVLIIGSGASGAAVAWSLAETRMRIHCLEQGDWVTNYAQLPAPMINVLWQDSGPAIFL